MSEPLLSDQLWQRIEPLLPKNKKKRNVQYAGRKPPEARAVLQGIIFVLKTGVPWKSLPATSDFPSGHTCRRRLLEWDKRGAVGDVVDAGHELCVKALTWRAHAQVIEALDSLRRFYPGCYWQCHSL